MQQQQYCTCGQETIAYSVYYSRKRLTRPRWRRKPLRAWRRCQEGPSAHAESAPALVVEVVVVEG